MWHDEVQPTLVTLRADLSMTRLVHDAALNLMTDTKAVISGTAGLGIYFGVGAVDNLASLSTLGLATAPVVAQSAAQSLKDAARKRQAARTPRPLLPPGANKLLR